jgi:hypothetical protein
MMARETFVFGQGDLWQVLRARDIDAKPNGTITAWVSRDNFVSFEDGMAGGGDLLPSFVLLAESVSNAIARSVIQIAKEHQLPVGFTVRDARHFERVFLVDPGDAFSADALFQLMNDRIEVKRISGSNAATIGDELMAAING